jgi:DNA transformation protein
MNRTEHAGRKRQTTPVEQLPNIGRKIAQRLNEIGVYTASDLRKLGPVACHQRISRKYSGETLPVCYYLYSFEGALRGVHWNDIGADKKKSLRQRIA